MQSPLLTRIVVWLGDNGHLLLCAVISFLLGLATMLPLGVALPDAVASLIGALLGSLATIGGALILWKAQEHQRTTHLARSIAMQFGSTLYACREVLLLTNNLKHVIDDANRHLEADQVMTDLAWRNSDLLREVTTTRGKLQRFNQSLHLLTSGQIGEFVLAETSLDTLYAIAETLDILMVQENNNPPGIFRPGKLNELHEKLHHSYTQLGDSLETFAPDWSVE